MKRQPSTVVRKFEPRKTTNNSTKKVVVMEGIGRCKRNFAAKEGGHVLDGCMQFIASGAEGTPAALSCAACGCHKCYHERVYFTKVVCDCSHDPSTSGSATA